MPERDKSMTTPPQLTDEAFAFIKDNSTDLGCSHFAFDGDWGNWNWLLGEIWKRLDHAKA